MNCNRCGKEMINTIGGNYHCPNCNLAIHDLVYRPSEYTIPLHQDSGNWKGWICPVCGKGLAPWVDYCPCNIDKNTTYISTGLTDVSLFGTYILKDDGQVPEAHFNTNLEEK